jgi:hypothetical protein
MAPKGQNSLAWGNGPGAEPPPNTALKGRNSNGNPGCAALLKHAGKNRFFARKIMERRPSKKKNSASLAKLLIINKAPDFLYLYFFR